MKDLPKLTLTFDFFKYGRKPRWFEWAFLWLLPTRKREVPHDTFPETVHYKKIGKQFYLTDIKQKQ